MAQLIAFVLREWVEDNLEAKRNNGNRSNDVS